MAYIFRASLGLILYTFLGYPAIIALLARLRPRPVRCDRGFIPSVSLIIAAHNEGEVIEQKLANVAALDYPSERLEVIVAADGSDDDTADRASAFPGTNVLFEPARRGKLAAITRAATQANGEVLVFSDTNNHYSTQTLRELVAPLSDPSVGVVSGRKQISSDDERALGQAEGLYWRYESKLKELESTAGSTAAVAGEILAFRREAIYWPPSTTLTEDLVQALIAAMNGWRVVYAPHAISVERASATIDHEATRRARLVAGASQGLMWLLPRMAARQPRLAWQVLSHKGLRPLVPAALFAYGASSLALAKTEGSARAMVVAEAAFYVCAALGRRDEARGRYRRWTYLPYYFCRMNAATMSGLVGLARRRQDAAWTRVTRG